MVAGHPLRQEKGEKVSRGGEGEEEPRLPSPWQEGEEEKEGEEGG